MQLIHGLNFKNIRGDILGGLTAAVVALPLALAFGETALGDGGAIYADAGNDIVITTSTFQGMLYIMIKSFDSHMSKLIM